MAAQMTYSYATPSGVPGGLLDINPYSTVSRLIEDAASIKFGLGVIKGTSDQQVKVGTGTFVGVLVEKAHELEKDNTIKIEVGESFTVLTKGGIWARVADGETTKFGDALHVNTDGTFATTGGTEVNGRFLGAAEDGIAPIELF